MNKNKKSRNKKKTNIQNDNQNKYHSIMNDVADDIIVDENKNNIINDNQNELTNDNAYHSIMNDVADDILCQLQYVCTIPKYNKKINDFLSYCIKIIFNNISPYLYIIISILVLIFFMNCFQFYYYVKLFIENSKNNSHILI